jgi:hypothetical protein
VQGYLSTHSLAELYSVITRLPLPLRVAPDEAEAVIMDLLESQKNEVDNKLEEIIRNLERYFKSEIAGRR